jgi:hypothetical protein
METSFSPRIIKKYLLVDSPYLKMFEGVDEYLSVSEMYYDGLIDELQRHASFLSDFLKIKEKMHGRGMGYDQYYGLIEKIWYQYVRQIRTDSFDDWQAAKINGLRLKHRWLIACGYLYLSVFETYQTTKISKSRLLLARRLDGLTEMMETALEDVVQATEEEIESFDAESYKEKMQRKMILIH